MKLYGTYPSHFCRKVRIVLAELEIKYEFVVLKQIAEVGAEKFAQNPLHQYPVLEDGPLHLIESNIICEYLIETYGKNASLSYLPKSNQKFEDKKRFAIINGTMDAGVKLIRAKRSEIPNFEKFTMFQQDKEAFRAGMEWLDNDLGKRSIYYPGQFSMLEITLMCLCEWTVFRDVLPNFKDHANLVHFVEENKGRSSFLSTHPSIG